jgi:hypothetical protein
MSMAKALADLTGRKNTGNTGWSDVTVTGLPELNRRLMELAKEATGPEVDAGLLRIANEMVRDMQARAHPDLRYTIVAKPFSRNAANTSASFVAIDRNTKDAKGRTMGRLAHLFEFGTTQRYRKSTRGKGGGIGNLIKVVAGTVGGATGAMAARPFFRPVVDKYRGDKFLTRLAQIVRSVVERREFGDTWGGGML